MKILVTIAVKERHRELLESKAPDAEFIYTSYDKVTKELLRDIDILIGNIRTDQLVWAKKVKWVQLQSAGTDGYLEPGVLAEDVILTNATGAYGLAIAEHLLGMTLTLFKKLPGYYEMQQKGQWSNLGEVRSIYGSTCLIVGMGDIGSEYAKRVKALGGYVIGIRRRGGEEPEYVDELYTLEQLNACLERADIVAASLPNTPETYHLFDAARFHKMKEQAVFLNVGRGNAVDTPSLIEALESGRLLGAALDVFEEEPLPADSPLWSTTNLIITPHVSGGMHLEETHNRIVEIAATNLEAFLKHTQMGSVVDRRTGYAKRRSE